MVHNENNNPVIYLHTLNTGICYTNQINTSRVQMDLEKILILSEIEKYKIKLKQFPHSKISNFFRQTK